MNTDTFCPQEFKKNSLSCISWCLSTSLSRTVEWTEQQHNFPQRDEQNPFSNLENRRFSEKKTWGQFDTELSSSYCSHIYLTARAFPLEMHFLCMRLWVSSSGDVGGFCLQRRPEEKYGVETAIQVGNVRPHEEVLWAIITYLNISTIATGEQKDM